MIAEGYDGPIPGEAPADAASAVEAPKRKPPERKRPTTEEHAEIVASLTTERDALLAHSGRQAVGLTEAQALIATLQSRSWRVLVQSAAAAFCVVVGFVLARL